MLRGVKGLIDCVGSLPHKGCLCFHEYSIASPSISDLESNGIEYNGSESSTEFRRSTTFASVFRPAANQNLSLGLVPVLSGLSIFSTI